MCEVDDEEQELGPVEDGGETRALRLHPLLREQLHKLVVQYLLATKSRELAQRRNSSGRRQPRLKICVYDEDFFDRSQQHKGRPVCQKLMPILCAVGRGGNVDADVELKKNVNHRLTEDSLARATKSASYCQCGEKPARVIGIS